MLRILSAAIVALTAGGAGAATVLINEFRPNPTGDDPFSQQIELLGAPGASFDGVLASIESDDTTTFGFVERLFSINGSFDSNGLLVTTIADLENPSFTLALLGSDTSLTLGFDVDGDDDGNLDSLASFGTVFDAISVIDRAGDAVDFGAELGGTDFAFTGDEPQLIFRDALSLSLFAINDPAGTTAIRSDGVEIDFSDFNFSPDVATLGSINPTAVPLPASALFLLSALGAGLFFRRRS